MAEKFALLWLKTLGLSFVVGLIVFCIYEPLIGGVLVVGGITAWSFAVWLHSEE